MRPATRLSIVSVMNVMVRSHGTSGVAIGQVQDLSQLSSTYLLQWRTC